MALHVITGSGAPAVTPQQIGMHYVDTVNEQHYLSVGTSSPTDWKLVGSSSASTFLQLADTPSSYAGQAGKYTRVNPGATGLEFSPTTFIEGIDTPDTYFGQAGKFVSVKPDETGVQFVAGGGGGGSSAIPQNNAYYVDPVTGDDALLPGRGQIQLPFKTIKAASELIMSLPGYGQEMFGIRLQNGVYLEDPFTIPIRTALTGLDVMKSVLIPKLEAGVFITLGFLGNISNVIIEGRLFGQPTSAKVDIGLSYPVAQPFSIQNTTISNCKIGLQVGAGSGSNVDMIITDSSFGDLGPCDIGIDLTGNARIGLSNVWGVGTGIAGGYAVRMSAGDYYHVGGRFLNYETAIRMTGGALDISSCEFLACAKAIDAGEDQSSTGVLAKVSSCTFTGLTDVTVCTAINVTGDNTFVDVSDADFYDFDKCIVAGGETVVNVKSAGFFVKIANDTIAIHSYESAVVKVFSAQFYGPGQALLDRAISGGTAIDCADNSFLDIWNSMFYNFELFCLATDLCQIQLYSTGLIDTLQNPASIGVYVIGGGYAYLYDSYAIAAVGFLAEEQSLLYMTTVSLGASTIHFVQRDTATIVTYQSEFDEDKIRVDNWDYVLGNYNSLKAGDEGIVCVSMLKVGTAELGRLSSMGGGNSFSRGMLVYEYDSNTGVYTDVSEIAKNPNGTFGIPSVDPDSAVYISCSLKFPDQLPVPFFGLWMDVETPAVYGAGSLIAEFFNGTSWERSNVMLTGAQEPYAVVNMENMIADAMYNARLSILIQRFWQPSDPVLPPIGTPYYWFRLRVASNWFDASWQYRMKVTIPAPGVFGVLTNFQTYLDLSIITDNGFWTTVLVNGGDIRITDQDGISQLPVEIVSFDRTARTGEIYFTKPNLTNAAEDYYYIYFGNPAAQLVPDIDKFGKYSVWKNYDLVVHGNGSTSTYPDSTVNNFNCSSTRVTRSAGKFGLQFAGDNTTGTGVYSPKPTVLTGTTRVLTHDVWFRNTAANPSRSMLTSSPNSTPANWDNWAISISNAGLIQYEFNNALTVSSRNVQDSLPHLATYTLDSAALTTNNLKGYVDGVQVMNQNTTAQVTSNTNQSLGIGNRGSGTTFWMNGTIDEVRVARIFRPLIWHQTLYANMNNNATWQTVGAIEDKALAPGSNPIAVAPRWNQFKLWTSATVINVDGFTELFGKARVIRPLPLRILEFNATSGTDTAGAGSAMFLSQDFGVNARYTFLPTGTRRITAVVRYGNDIDLSCHLQIKVGIIPRGGVSGDVLMRIVIASAGASVVYSTSQAAAPISTANQQEILKVLTIDVSQRNTEIEQQFELPLPIKQGQLSFAERTDLFWISFTRLGDSYLDTYTGNIDVLYLDCFGVGYRLGEHSSF